MSIKIIPPHQLARQPMVLRLLGNPAFGFPHHNDCMLKCHSKREQPKRLNFPPVEGLLVKDGTDQTFAVKGCLMLEPRSLVTRSLQSHVRETTERRQPKRKYIFKAKPEAKSVQFDVVDDFPDGKRLHRNDFRRYKRRNKEILTLPNINSSSNKKSCEFLMLYLDKIYLCIMLIIVD